MGPEPLRRRLHERRRQVQGLVSKRARVRPDPAEERTRHPVRREYGRHQLGEAQSRPLRGSRLQGQQHSLDGPRGEHGALQGPQPRRARRRAIQGRRPVRGPVGGGLARRHQLAPAAGRADTDRPPLRLGQHLVLGRRPGPVRCVHAGSRRHGPLQGRASGGSAGPPRPISATGASWCPSTLARRPTSTSTRTPA